MEWNISLNSQYNVESHSHISKLAADFAWCHLDKNPDDFSQAKEAASFGSPAMVRTSGLAARTLASADRAIGKISVTQSVLVCDWNLVCLHWVVFPSTIGFNFRSSLCIWKSLEGISFNMEEKEG